VLDGAEQARLTAEIEAEIQAAFDFAIASPFPDPAGVKDHVYA
jgi:TPP-dependent pyruvate/acetoin dehydrogenase alpha subunit